MIERCGVRGFMSLAAQNDMDNLILDHRELRHRREPLLPFTEENAFNFYTTQLGKLKDHFTAAVVEVFNYLRPWEHDRAAGLKSNQNDGVIGERTIVSYAVCNIMGDHGYFTSRWGQMAIALENVLRGLDGKGTIARANHSDLAIAFKEQGPAGET
jgi:hypothetical protein